MGNVLDLTERLKSHATVGPQSVSAGVSPVVDLAQMRSQMITEDRRQVKRTILTEFISVHAVVPGHGVLRVALYDITEAGLSFDLEQTRGHYNIGETIELRVYLNHQTYFKISTEVVHITEFADEGIVRHGCEFIAGSINDDALGHFVKFLENVTASLRRDGGDVLVTKINS